MASRALSWPDKQLMPFAFRPFCITVYSPCGQSFFPPPSILRYFQHQVTPKPPLAFSITKIRPTRFKLPYSPPKIVTRTMFILPHSLPGVTELLRAIFFHKPQSLLTWHVHKSIDIKMIASDLFQSCNKNRRNPFSWPSSCPSPLSLQSKVQQGIHPFILALVNLSFKSPGSAALGPSPIYFLPPRSSKLFPLATFSLSLVLPQTRSPSPQQPLICIILSLLISARSLQLNNLGLEDASFFKLKPNWFFFSQLFSLNDDPPSTLF